MQQLMKAERVKDEKDLVLLRRLCDRVETHYRGLEALGIEKNTYSSIVVPHILDCLPESVRLIITREKDFHEWDVENLLEPLKREIELREEHREPERKGSREFVERSSWKRSPSSAQALHTKSRVEACAFCLGMHRHEECNRMNMEHHTALCDQGKVHKSKPKGPEADGGERETAQAMFVGKKSGRVRVLLDSGSQRTLVTVKVAKALGCEVVRVENLSIGTFGQRALDSELRNVVRLELRSLFGSQVVSVDTYVVPEISVIRNQHLEVVRENYAHLKDLWLSDVCKSSEDLEVDVLVGADYLWLLQRDCVRRGKPGEPVAIDTVLGWVVSGPIGGFDVDEPVTAQVNLVSSEVRNPLVDITKFWDLESIGIKDQNSDVHESVISDLKFSGTRYSVGLPWKESQDPLPTNYEFSLKRMKGQIKRLNKDPVLLGEYDSIIKAQEEAGVIEKAGGQFGKVLGLEWDCMRDLIRFDFDHYNNNNNNNKLYLMRVN
ncbi:E3 ubiquitin- ligase DZIP3 [Paramuricea clavata]|uniref:E3 ubiquitin- ligase DZIP3 n=1 Tax=Paramuricea clavata TaxID=317549 RepID=A0A7D9IDG3_PARCT|nr:E3 ubiquitin- ligase DZIP3 [Paramuricea clavata]